MNHQEFFINPYQVLAYHLLVLLDMKSRVHFPEEMVFGTDDH